MANFKQINYIKTMLSKASNKTKRDFEDGVMLNKETPNHIVQAWIKRLENEVGVESA